jgi:hypothetical protein
MVYSINVYNDTQDDWYPCYKVDNLSLCAVSFYQNNPTEHIVCVWGADDCGMEILLEKETEALNLFYQIIGQEFVNRAYLLTLGLKSA